MTEITYTRKSKGERPEVPVAENRSTCDLAGCSKLSRERSLAIIGEKDSSDSEVVQDYYETSEEETEEKGYFPGSKDSKQSKEGRRKISGGDARLAGKMNRERSIAIKGDADSSDNEALNDYYETTGEE